MSEVYEVMGDMSFKLSTKHPEYGPLQETHNRSQVTATDPCSQESWDEGFHPMDPARSYWKLSTALTDTTSAGYGAFPS